jgi:hypothetical protein
LGGNGAHDAFMPLILAALMVAVSLCEIFAGGSGERSVFTVSPIPPNEIREIIPLGNLNPVGGHVFPTDHIYLDYRHKLGLVVCAPAGGTITSIRDQFGGDVKIEIRVDDNISYYLAHLYLEPGIVVGSQITAGQKLGLASGKSMLDLGTSDTRARLPGFANPARYPLPTLNTVSPLALFAEPLRSQLYEKVKRSGPDKNGKIDIDKPGRLVGNWFHESLAVRDSSRGDPAVWAKQLSFAYDVHNPKTVRISVGGTIAPAGLYGILDSALDPADVGRETGAVKYRLVRVDMEGSKRPSTPASGLLLVELIGEDRLKVEYFAGPTSDDVKDFDQQASVYER